MRVLTISVLLACFASYAQAGLAKELPWAKAQAAYEAALPGQMFHEYATAFGDISGDGVMDFVSFVGDPQYGDHGVEDLRIAVFLGQRRGGFRYWQSSQAVLGHERVSSDLKIVKQSVYLHRDGSGECCSHWVEDFQFKMRHGRLMLVGLETAEAHPMGVEEPDFGSSFNFLTKQKVDWKGSGSKRKRVRSKLGNKIQPIPLDAFNYEDFTIQMSGDTR